MRWNTYLVGSHRQKNPSWTSRGAHPLAQTREHFVSIFNIPRSAAALIGDVTLSNTGDVSPMQQRGGGIATASLLPVEKKKILHVAPLRQAGSFNRARQESRDRSEKDPGGPID